MGEPWSELVSLSPVKNLKLEYKFENLLVKVKIWGNMSQAQEITPFFICIDEYSYPFQIGLLDFE